MTYKKIKDLLSKSEDGLLLLDEIRRDSMDYVTNRVRRYNRGEGTDVFRVVNLRQKYQPLISKYKKNHPSEDASVFDSLDDEIIEILTGKFAKDVMDERVK